MRKCKTRIGLKRHLSAFRDEEKTIGFVPTMGALHQGHISLVQRARDENDIVVVSIFVNPKQFNNKTDLKKYPRTVSKDLKMLDLAGCDVVFLPGIEDIYPDKNPNLDFDPGQLGSVLEGKFRPGHFEGVALVVKRLFDLTQPNRSYFGEKDYQQLLIVKKMVRDFRLGVEIVPCSIIREDDGLAMSSRNERLSVKDRSMAPFIYEQLKLAVESSKDLSVAQIKDMVVKNFSKRNEFELEYFEIVDINNFQIVNNWTDSKNYRALIVAYLGGVRLIDNTAIIL